MFRFVSPRCPKKRATRPPRSIGPRRSPSVPVDYRRKAVERPSKGPASRVALRSRSIRSRNTAERFSYYLFFLYIHYCRIYLSIKSLRYADTRMLSSSAFTFSRQVLLCLASTFPASNVYGTTRLPANVPLFTIRRNVADSTDEIPVTERTDNDTDRRRIYV